MLDGVPWAIGGDAEHGPDVARQLAYLACGGRQGVGRPGDLKVTALDVPGAGAQVAPGLASVLNRVATQQAYIPRNATADVDSVKFGATGSSSGRSDMVVLAIDNPYIDGNAQAPADPIKGPYNRFRVLPVPAGTTSLQSVPEYAGMSAIELARVDIPKSTQTITNAMITDLRTLATPRSDTQNGPGVLTGKTLTLSTSTWQQFPENPIGGFTVPPWATHAVVTIFTSVSYQSGNALAKWQTFMDPVTGHDDANLCSDQQMDFTTGNGYRQAAVIPTQGDWPIPTALRGKDVRLVSRVLGIGTSDGAKISTGANDYYTATVTFKEKTA